MFRENHSRNFPTPNFPTPSMEQLSLYGAAREFSKVIEALHPSLSWVGVVALSREEKKREKEKQQQKDTKPMNSIETQSELLLDRLLGPEYRKDGEFSLNAITNTVMSDWLHLLKEISVAETITRYQYKIPKGDQEWIGPGYIKKMSELASNLVQALADRGILSWRAFIEQFVLKRLAENIANAAKDTLWETYFLVTSAPDDLNYHGSESAAQPTNKKAKETHHSFLYLMNASDDTIDVTQFRTWHNYAQLLALHESFDAGFALEPHGSAGSQLFANVITLRFPKGTSREAVEAVVKAKIYQKSSIKTWHRKPDQLPKFSELGTEAFWTEIMGMAEGDLEEASKVLAQALSEKIELHEVAAHAAMTDSLVKDVFIPQLLDILKEARKKMPLSPDTKKLFAEQVTRLHQLLLSAAEQKVQWYNTNPKYAELVATQAVTHFPKNPSVSLKTLERLAKAKWHKHKPLSQDVLTEEAKDATDLLALDKKQLFAPHTMTEEERKRHGKLTNQFAVVSFILGSSECYLFTALKAAAESGGAFSAELATPAGFVELGKLPLEARRAKIKKEITPSEAARLVALYETKNYVELDLPGAEQIWMVPAEYLVLGDGCRVDPETGKVLGPCDSMPLDHPSNEDAMAMTAETFYENLDLLRERAKDTDWKEMVEKAKAKTSPDEHQELEELLAKAKKALIKDTVSLTEMLSDDLLERKVRLDHWLATIAELLEGPGNPILLLREVVAELLEQQTEPELITAYPQS